MYKVFLQFAGIHVQKLNFYFSVAPCVLICKLTASQWSIFMTAWADSTSWIVRNCQFVCFFPSSKYWKRHLPQKIQESTVTLRACVAHINQSLFPWSIMSNPPHYYMDIWCQMSYWNETTSFPTTRETFILVMIFLSPPHPEPDDPRMTPTTGSIWIHFSGDEGSLTWEITLIRNLTRCVVLKRVSHLHFMILKLDVAKSAINPCDAEPDTNCNMAREQRHEQVLSLQAGGSSNI